MNAVLSRRVLVFTFPVLLSALFGGVPTDPMVFEQVIWNENNNTIGLLEATRNFPEEKEEVLVAIYSSGINLQHEDLQGKIWVNPGEIAGNGIDDDGNGWIDDVNGLKIGEAYANDYGTSRMKTEPYPTGDINDWHGLGTYMAGVIAAVRDNGLGGAGMVEKVKILPISPPPPDPKSQVSKYRFPQGWSGFLFFDTAVDYAIQQGADILIVPGLNVQDLEVFDRAEEAGLLIVVEADHRAVEDYIDVLHYPNLVICPHPVYRETDYSEKTAQYLDFRILSPGNNACPVAGSENEYFSFAYYLLDPHYNNLIAIGVERHDQLALVAGSFAWLKTRFPDESNESLYTRLHQAGVPHPYYPSGNAEILAINLADIVEEPPEKYYQKIEVSVLINLVSGEDKQPVQCSSSSGLPVTIEVLSGPASVDASNKIITTGEPGTVQLRLTQDGNDQYLPAESRELTFSILDLPVFQVEQTIDSEVTGNSRYDKSLWQDVAIWGDYMLATSLEATDTGGYCGVLFLRGDTEWNVVNLIPFSQLGFGNIQSISNIEIAANDQGFIIGAQVRTSSSGGQYFGKVVFVTINPNHSYDLNFLEGYGTVDMASRLEVAGDLIMVYYGRGHGDVMKFFTFEDNQWNYVDELSSPSSNSFVFGGDDLLVTRHPKTYHIVWDSSHNRSIFGEQLNKNGGDLYIGDSKPEAMDGQTLVLGNPYGVWSGKKSGYLDVYEKSSSGRYEYSTTLGAYDAFDGQEFGGVGATIVIDGNFLATATAANSDYGKSKPEVYVFHRTEGGEWKQSSRIRLPNEPSPDLRDAENPPGLYLHGNELVVFHQTSLCYLNLDDLKQPMDAIAWEFPELVSADEISIPIEASSISGARVEFTVISGNAQIISNQLIFGEDAGEIIIEGRVAEFPGYEAPEPVYKALTVKPGSLWTETYDQWCEGYNLNPPDMDPEADLDRDGNSNLMEYALNGNPARAESHPLFEVLPMEGEVVVRIPCRADGAMPKMFLERLSPDDMQTWESVKEIFTVFYEGVDIYLEQEIRLPMTAESCLYRIRLVR